MEAITLTMPPGANLDIANYEDFSLLCQANPHLHIEYLGDHQVSISNKKVLSEQKTDSTL